MNFSSLKSLFDKNQIIGSTLIFKDGWNDWRALESCKVEIGLSVQNFKKPLSFPPPPVVTGQAAQKLSINQKNHENNQFHGQKTNIQKLAYSRDEASKFESVHQARSPRYKLQGQVLVHNNDNLVFTQTANISSQGVFVKTDKPIFNIGEILKLTCRIKQLGKPFHAEAQVVRRNTSGSEPSGYGLFFTSIKPEISQRIERIADIKK